MLSRQKVGVLPRNFRPNCHGNPSKSDQPFSRNCFTLACLELKVECATQSIYREAIFGKNDVVPRNTR